MEAVLHNAAEWIAIVIEAAGIGVIALGLVLATGAFLMDLRSPSPFSQAFQQYRRNTGRGILLGLEFLVAGDIIQTVVVDLTWESLGGLAIIVVIRTFLSFALEVEVTGRWPWQGESNAGDATSL